MCRGLAVCFSWDDGFYTKGVSSHMYTQKRDEDLKLEIIIDDSKDSGYSVELDEQYYHDKKLDKVVYELHKDKITHAGRFRKDFKKLLDEWVHNNETMILRHLLRNQTYQKHKKNQDMRFCEAGKNQYMSYCKAGKSQYMRFCEAGEYQYMSYCKAGKSQYMSSCEAGENQDMRSCKAGMNQDMRYCSCGGERYVSYMTGKDEEVNDFIEKLSDELGGEYDSLTWDYLVRLAMKGYEVRE